MDEGGAEGLLLPPTFLLFEFFSSSLVESFLFCEWITDCLKLPPSWTPSCWCWFDRSWWMASSAVAPKWWPDWSAVFSMSLPVSVTMLLTKWLDRGLSWWLGWTSGSGGMLATFRMFFSLLNSSNLTDSVLSSSSSLLSLSFLSHF